MCIRDRYVDRAMYNMKRAVQNFFRELLELLFNAAALVIDTLRTFFLIVLSILGPVSFAISCWDGCLLYTSRCV